MAANTPPLSCGGYKKKTVWLSQTCESLSSLRCIVFCCAPIQYRAFFQGSNAMVLILRAPWTGKGTSRTSKVSSTVMPRRYIARCWLSSRKVLGAENRMFGYMGGAMRKRVCGHMWTVKAQISLRVCAGWSGLSLLTNSIIGYYTLYEWGATEQWTIIFECARWTESAPFAHVWRHYFAGAALKPTRSSWSQVHLYYCYLMGHDTRPNEITWSGIIRGNPNRSVAFRIVSVVIRSSACISVYIRDNFWTCSKLDHGSNNRSTSFLNRIRTYWFVVVHIKTVLIRTYPYLFVGPK